MGEKYGAEVMPQKMEVPIDSAPLPYRLHRPAECAGVIGAHFTEYPRPPARLKLDDLASCIIERYRPHPLPLALDGDRIPAHVGPTQVEYFRLAEPDIGGQANHIGEDALEPGPGFCGYGFGRLDNLAYFLPRQ